MTGKDALLLAFDRLFDKAAAKLTIAVSSADKSEAIRDFAERSAPALDIVEQIAMPAFPEETMSAMEEAIDRLAPAQLVAYLAAIPLAHQTQEALRRVAHVTAEQRLLEHYAGQADDRYGGN